MDDPSQQNADYNPDDKRERVAALVHEALGRDDFGVANEDEREEVLDVADAIMQSELFPSTEELAAKVAALQELLGAIFGALDGENTSYEYGTFKNGTPATIGGIYSFVSTWDSQEIPEWRGTRWEELTQEQRYESARWSAQHALVKELADLRKRYDDQKDS